MKNTYNFKIRATAFVLVIVFVVSIFLADLFRIQVILRDEYASKRFSLSSVETQVSALRGEILDCNGQALVYNVKSNTIYIDASYFPKAKEQEKRNEIILSLIKLLDEYEVPYNASLPIENVDGELTFVEGSDGDKSYLFAKDYLNLNDYATPQNVYDALCEYYELGNLSQEYVLKIAGLYFRMTRADFSTINPFTVATDVPDETVLIIKEQSRFYEGIEIRVDSSRAYYDGTIAPHIIGFYDYINAEEYKNKSEEYKELLSNASLTEEDKKLLSLKSYRMTDKIGKFGIESAMETELRGTNGIMTTVTNSDGTKTTSITRDPVNGNNIILTIDGDFQLEVQKILAERIESTKDSDSVAAAGSIVVMDVNDFSILACATYPSYDLSTYKKNIVELNRDETAPLWNRALRSTYAPGSTVKPIVATAGLEEGIVAESTEIRCNILYTYFPDRAFQCFNVGNHAGRGINVIDALKYSCNTYFYDVGRQLGITKLNQYFAMFGLGTKTGVELTEAIGIIAGPTTREQMGGVWYPGDTIQAAIGQSDNLFTPIQLCTYVATLANGGNRYQAHFVKSIKSADYSQTILETQPFLVAKLDISEATKASVKKGMMAMAQTLSAFRKLPYSVASKTGTAQAKKKVDGVWVEYTNGFMISYAPADNPQIAVAVAVENVSSTGLALYVSAIYEAYFNRNSNISSSQQGNIILR